MEPLTDGRGCLTESGLQAVERAPVGQAPSELSRHVASCGRCQDRLLLRGSGATPGRERRRPPPLWRTVVVAVAALLLMVAAWIAARLLM